MQFETLTGFREFYPEACALRTYFCGLAKDRGVLQLLGIRCSGLRASRALHRKVWARDCQPALQFEIEGAAVALRPEMTPSLARLVGDKANSLKRPIKWFNIGEHYRYERPQKGRLRAFYQFNVDIFGEAGPSADAELISLLVQTLQGFGLNDSDFKVRLSDRDLWLLMLASEGLDEFGSAAILGVIDKMERTPREKTIEQMSTFLGDHAEVFLEQIEKVVQIREFGELRDYIENLLLEGDRKDEAEARLSDWEKLLGARGIRFWCLCADRPRGRSWLGLLHWICLRSL